MTTTSSVHIAALPFPTYQGTQAAIAAMLNALTQEQQADLVCYPHRSFETHARWRAHRDRTTSWLSGSLRSGPRVEKLIFDFGLYRCAKALCKTKADAVLIGHHAEGLMIAQSVNQHDAIYVAHTNLDEELPTYFGSPLKSVMRFAGSKIDRFCMLRSSRVAAVSPALQEYLENKYQRPVVYLPIPWTRSMRIQERAPEHASTLRMLYVGNLDRYQGFEDLLLALKIMRTNNIDAELCVCTASDSSVVDRQATQIGVADRVKVVALSSDAVRDRVYQEADCVLVPRRTGLGVPVKLLDALTRGKHIVAYQNACGGLPLGHCIETCDAHPKALAAVLSALVGVAGKTISAQTVAARHEYLEKHHGQKAFMSAWNRLTQRD